MAIVKRKTTSEPKSTVYSIKKIALAIVTREKVKVSENGPNAFLLTYKKPRSKLFLKEVVHRNQVVSISGGETGFDGTVTYRGIDTVYEGRGTITSIDSNSITFKDAEGNSHYVPASNENGIVLSITSDGMDLSAVKEEKAKVAKKADKPAKVGKTAKADKSEKKVDKAKPRAGALPHPNKK